MSEKWRVVGGFHDNFYGVQMGDWGGFMLPKKEGAQERAERIVLACNYFEEMRHMLEMVLRDLDGRLLPAGTLTTRELVRNILSRIEEAERV